jgi:hypothetical protein
MDEDGVAALIGGEDGGAAPEAAPEPTEAPEPVAAPEPAVQRPEPGHVPLAAMLDEREKRRAAERRLAEVEARAAEAQARAADAQAQQADPAPDPARDAQLWALRMDLSRELAVSRHGEEEADALQQWGVARCDADPAFNAQVYRSRNPYEFIRQARQREQLLTEVKPEDLDDYRAWKAAKASQDRPSTMNAGGPGPTAPPRSLADAPNAGGAGAHSDLQIGPGTAFSQTIRR